MIHYLEDITHIIKLQQNGLFPLKIYLIFGMKPVHLFYVLVPHFLELYTIIVKLEMMSPLLVLVV